MAFVGALLAAPYAAGAYKKTKKEGTASSAPTAQGSILLRRDSEGFHFAVERAALEAEPARAARHVSVILPELAEDHSTRVGVTGRGDCGRACAHHFVVMLEEFALSCR